MKIGIFQRTVKVGGGVLLAALLSLGAVRARSQWVCWGGAGFDPRENPSCRFRAYYLKQDGTVRIRVDTYETFENVAAMRLMPLQGRPLVSKSCWKISRRAHAPWECSFPPGDIQACSGLGRVIVENRYGHNLVTDDLDFDEINLFFNDGGNKDEDPYFSER